MRCNGCLYDGVCWEQIEETIDENETSECFEAANNFVKVVRCEDCKHGEDGADGRILCTRRAHKWNGLVVGATATHPDDFCSYGERKVRAMSDEKLISVISTIERAVGTIEGVSYGLCDSQASALIDAVGKIGEALEVLKENG